MRKLFLFLALFAMICAVQPASAGEGIRCIPVELTVNTNHQGLGVHMGVEKKGRKMDEYGTTPAVIEMIAVVREVPGEKNPELYLVLKKDGCPGADADFSALPDETRYFYIEPGHTGYIPVKNKKKKIVKLKEVLKALDKGDEKIETDIKFTMKLPRGDAMPAWG
jgi:hypothetical protein